MLILPMERTFSLQKAPLITLVLLLLNVVIFFVTNSRDQEELQAAVSAYEEAQILEVEFPLFQTYLIRSGEQDTPWHKLQSLDKLGEVERFYLVAWMLTDMRYAQFLDAEAGSRSEAEQVALEEKQQIVDAHITRLSSHEYGFTPSRFSPFTLFSSQFLHGGLGHLIGNMVILVLVGLTVEQLLGSFNYLLFYLLSGALGAVTYGLVHFGSPMPLIGASGAISGLMGMYVAAYGRRPIRFFYWVGIYFNYIRLPALVMLPVWVGKEIFDYLVSDTGVAYTAHAGGLVAGAALVVIGKSSFARLDTEIIEHHDDEQEYREKLGRALQQIDRADLDAAKTALWRLHEQFPERGRVLFQLVQLEKLDPAAKPFHVAVYHYLKAALASGSLDTDARDVVRHYWEHAAPRPLIKGALLSQLINTLTRVGEIQLAQTLCASAQEHQLLKPEVLKEVRAYLERQRKLREKPA